MRIRLSTFIGMILAIGGASIVARVVKVITSKNEEAHHDKDDSNPSYLDKSNYKENNHMLTDTIEHVIWFIQISDLHFSIFHDKSRISSFEEFANETVTVLQPSVVLASGDLTDGKKLDGIGSDQYLKEWEIYSGILQKTNVQNKTIWLDIRGNHDNFNVPSLSSYNNYYQYYSVQGPSHQRSYMYTLKKGLDTVSFIAVDACLLPGPRRPFNFIGVLTPKEMKALERFEEESKKTNYTVWFGHYPTSCIISPEPGIRRLMANGLAYLCGHLHTLGGFFPTLYTRQHTGYLELELGDWKDSRVFRVMAIDHGLFSFTDVHIGEWPVILVTNPKHALFSMPQNEPLHITASSTHVRVLVWSINPITSVKLRFNNAGVWKQMTHVDGPLYVAPWDSLSFSNGMHTLEVVAEDSGGWMKLFSQSFSLDGSKPEFSFWARVILMSNVSFVFQFLFGTSICLCILPLCTVRWMHHLVKEKKMARPRMQCRLIKLWLRKLWVLCCVDKLFWPLVLSTVYLPIGPWFVGEVMDGHIGAVFAWGTIVFSSYLPGSLTYAYGFVQAVLYHCPLIILTAHSSDLRLQSLFMIKPPSRCTLVCRHFLFACLVFIQGFNAYFFFLAYGTMALVLGPLRTWSVLLGIYLWYSSAALKQRDLRSVAGIWGMKSNFLTSFSCNGSDSNSKNSSESPSKSQLLTSSI